MHLLMENGKLKKIEISGSALIDWMYPDIYGTEAPRDRLSIALYHVRAANNIEIEYNSDKDGWDIFQIIPIGDFKQGVDGIWVKEEKTKLIAFVPAWDEEYSFND